MSYVLRPDNFHRKRSYKHYAEEEYEADKQENCEARFKDVEKEISVAEGKKACWKRFVASLDFGNKTSVIVPRTDSQNTGCLAVIDWRGDEVL